MFKKRNIIILNLALFIIFGVSCYGMIASFVRKPRLELKKKRTRLELTTAQVVQRPPRKEYDIITKNNIFDAKLTPPPMVREEKPAPPLNWKLQGTLFINGKWVAYIEMPTTQSSSSQPPESRTPRRGRTRPAPKQVKKDVVRVEEGDTILEHDVLILEIRENYVKYERTYHDQVSEDYLYIKNPDAVSIFGQKKADYSSIVKTVLHQANVYTVDMSELEKVVGSINEALEKVELDSLGGSSSDTEPEGVRIIQVENPELLYAFGLEKSDVLLKINDQKIGSVEKLTEVLGSLGEKNRVSIEIRRGRKPKQIQIEYNIRP